MPSAPPYPVVNGRDLIIPKGTAVTAYISGDLLLDESRFVSRKPSVDNAEAAVPVIAATPVTRFSSGSEPFCEWYREFVLPRRLDPKSRGQEKRPRGTPVIRSLPLFASS